MVDAALGHAAVLPGPHDALFRYVFSQPEHAAAELRSVLPATLSARLDWSSLELSPSSFIDEQLSETGGLALHDPVRREAGVRVRARASEHE